MKIIGIDLGEYGFGWAVFNCSTERFEDKGFVEIKQLKNLFLMQFTGFKNREERGVWNRPTSLFSIKLKNAVNTTQNQIDYLSEKFGARPIFETFEEMEGHKTHIFKLIHEQLILKYVPDFQNGQIMQQFENKWGSRWIKNVIRDSLARQDELEKECTDIAERFLSDWEQKYLN